MDTEHKQNTKRRLSFFELLTEISAWLQIVASPLLAGLVLGFLIYISVPYTTGIVMGLLVALVGLVIGIVWATRVWKKRGTVHFMSRIMATPELDKLDEEQDDSTQQKYLQ